MQIGVQAHLNGIAWSSEFRTVVQRLVVVGFTSPFIHFVWRQFHGVRFYAPPRRLPRILEATVDTIITIIVAKDQQIVFDKNTFSSNGNIIWLLSEGAAQLQRIKIVWRVFMSVVSVQRQAKLPEMD